ncbi:redoxin family protein [Candidatus Uhrbacteria bacterium]|nr:redoxin family protein [Candidatus Uhrbacteria bacterium]MBD3284082.1 redoxin family protein [Candidatus Uhrbacteria bacterium]
MKHDFLPLLLACTMLISVVPAVQAAERTNGQLIKASGPAVYYFNNDKRYVFPNDKVFFSWYNNFDHVLTISDAELAAIQIAGNVTYRPGKRLVKITTDPKVYAISDGNVLRWIPSEALAVELYGTDWATKVHDVPDAFFINYEIGDPLTEMMDYPVNTVLESYNTFEQVIRKEAQHDPVANDEPPSNGGATYEEYSNATYEAALTNDKPTVLFFYANWCPTCLAEEPHLQQIVAETENSVNVIRVNTKDNDTDADEEQLADDFNIFTQHTFVFLDANGNETKRVIGTQGKEELRRLIEEL